MSHELYKLLTYLDEEALLYRLDRTPPDAVTIFVALEGERFEITVAENADVQFVRFTGDSNVGDPSSAIARLYQRLRTKISD